MANLFKKNLLRTDAKTGEPIRKKSAKWWGRYRDALDIDRRVPLAKDKATIQAMLNEIVRKVELEKSGQLSPFNEHAKRPIAEHIADFETHLMAKGTKADYIKDLKAKLERVFSNAKVKTISDIGGNQIERALHQLREEGLSAQTYNHYLRTVKQFTRWLVRDRRLGDDPLAYMSRVNVQVDRRHDRRALSSEEFERLIAAAEAGKVVESIPGPDRAIMYVLSAWTGYRKGEIGSLTRKSFCLEAPTPTATVLANYSKRKREDSQVLHSAVVERLQEWLATKTDVADTAPLFPVSGKFPGVLEHKTAKMMTIDLATAREHWLNEAESSEERATREQSDSLAYRDNSGLFADFHSNRHTFITSLSRNQVTPQMAQTLARHSDSRLTMGTYTHVELSDQKRAIESLPAPPKTSSH